MVKIDFVIVKYGSSERAYLILKSVIMAPIDFNEFLRSSGRKNDDPVDYHLVHRRDVSRGIAKKSLRLKEFDLRVKKAIKKYKGRYDEAHAHWMRRLAYDVNISDKLGMSLDTYKAFTEVCK